MIMMEAKMMMMERNKMPVDNLFSRISILKTSLEMVELPFSMLLP